jgi:hypothetical protein
MQITVMPVAITKWQLLLRPKSICGKGVTAYFVHLHWCRNTVVDYDFCQKMA